MSTIVATNSLALHPYGDDPAPLPPPPARTAPLPTHPLPTMDQDTADDPEAGPSHQHQHQRQMSIPPPAHARRHRSGVLMSAARSRASSGGFKAGMAGSKSFGDLSLGLTMSTAVAGTSAGEGGAGDETEEGEFRRITSEGSSSRRPSGEEEMWDNSARFYHHLHSTSRPVSRQTSPEREPSTPLTSPSRSSSVSSSPIHVRRSTLPTNGPGPPLPMTQALSPAHAFLQSHLPPLFPSPGSSPEHQNQYPHMVILTPTTAEWKELKKEMGEELDRVESSSDSESGTGTGTASGSRPSSSEDIKQAGSRSGSRSRPPLQSTVSADYIQREQTHTPDPGSSSPPVPDLLTPSRPTFQQNIIAPSPTFPHSEEFYPAEVDPDQPILFTDGDGNENGKDSPQRFASIGRRESLRAVPKVIEPKQKTKRELERERLFKDLDEELEADKESPIPFVAVQQIGQGLKLSESGKVISDDEPEQQPIRRSTGSTGSGSTSSISPTIPFKPSPLHGSPLLAKDTLSSPEESPELPNIHTANLETIRDYARSLAEPQEPTLEIPNPMSPVIETKSPRMTHRRDTKRVSLVAGRVVQPFSVPADTALPPNSEKHVAKRTSLNSFSPFKTPVSSSPTGFPGFTRMDSTVSVAPSTGPPSEPGTPNSETAGGLGGRGIDDYLIVSEAGKGAYGLVMRARVKGQNGEPIGEEVIIKYIVKVRILADCWKKHKVLGPIPVESKHSPPKELTLVHVMDQLRHLMYNTPAKPHPWDPTRSKNGEPSSRPPASPVQNGTPTPPSRTFSSSLLTTAQRYLASELKVSPERGHPNICKLIDFFEDREFYYRLDLFDRVEASPDGLPVFDVRSLIGQLADAVRFLHSNGIVHRDIKDENVILDGEGRCQLIDFGSAAHWRPGKRWDTFSGTLHYASPEILRGDLYGGKEQDVYALGTVMYVLLVGETPFAELPDEVLAGLTEGSRALDALKERCEPAMAVDDAEEDGGGGLQAAQDLVRRCLELEVGDRPPAEAVCNHRFLKGKEGWMGHRGWIKPRI